MPRDIFLVHALRSRQCQSIEKREKPAIRLQSNEIQFGKGVKGSEWSQRNSHTQGYTEIEKDRIGFICLFIY